MRGGNMFTRLMIDQRVRLVLMVALTIAAVLGKHGVGDNLHSH
jgi:hypothetical protein